MKTHEQIDQRSLLMAKKIVAKIDKDPERNGLNKARGVCQRWASHRAEPVTKEWGAILTQSWETIRQILLEDSDNSRRLRQSSPFCGILSPQERWNLYKAFDSHETY
ncbi:MAG: hypothetical protein K9N55_00400 [Phycisphaerae bacterium]|nr:hypothetical protein [Phycisphaerae bacterium]